MTCRPSPRANYQLQIYRPPHLPADNAAIAQCLSGAVFVSPVARGSSDSTVGFDIGVGVGGDTVVESGIQGGYSLGPVLDGSGRLHEPRRSVHGESAHRHSCTQHSLYGVLPDTKAMLRRLRKPQEANE